MSFRTAALYSKCQTAKYVTVKQFKPSVKRQPIKVLTFFPNCRSSCEKVTGSNVINISNGGLCAGGGGGGCTPGAKAFLLVTDNRRSRLDSPFCVITQHMKFEFGHHRQSKKISNAQELTVQLSQTLSSAIAQIKVSNSPMTNHTNKILPQRPPLFFNFCIT